MYRSMFQKRLSRSKPFHQKVLRFQYEVPLSNLKKAFEYASMLSQEHLFMAEDSAINGLVPVDEKFSFDESVFNPSADTKTVGIFDMTESFYIRLQIDSIENAPTPDTLCGNLSIFASEGQLIEIANAFQQACLGQVMLEGASDYFALLED